MTKNELLGGFCHGFSLQQLLPAIPGQDCQIFKAERFRTDDEIIYIPDIELNNITFETVPVDEDVQYTLDRCYSGADFVELCEGDEALAYRLFCYCDWQHPISALDEVYYEDEADKADAQLVYEMFKLSR